MNADPSASAVASAGRNIRKKYRERLSVFCSYHLKVARLLAPDVPINLIIAPRGGRNHAGQGRTVAFFCLSAAADNDVCLLVEGIVTAVDAKRHGQCLDR